MDDSFIRGYIDDVLRSLRTQWILEIIKPYTRIEIDYLARVSLRSRLLRSLALTRATPTATRHRRRRDRGHPGLAHTRR